jgi:glycosyltransferase involved in cell wall biosynthesis
MRIALDVSNAVRPEATGVAIYVRQLVAALAQADTEDAFTLVHRLSRVRHRGHFVEPPASNFRTKLLAEGWHPFWGREVDVFHGLDARLPGPWMKAKLVVTIHDVFSALQSEAFATADFRAMKTARYRDVIDRAERIVVVSEASKNDVLSTLKPDAAKLRVIHESAGKEFGPRKDEEIQRVRARHQLERPYLLYVGSINKRKNVPAMVRAFLHAREKAGSDAVLAIAGRTGFGGDEIKAALGLDAPRDEIRLLGYVANQELAPLYAGAWGLLFATLYEGFGIPVVEAFRCGCPVIGGTKGSVPEIAGGAALLADPASEDEIAAQVERLLSDTALREELRAKGRERAQAFSWERTAKETLAVYREVMGA